MHMRPTSCCFCKEYFDLYGPRINAKSTFEWVDTCYKKVQIAASSHQH